LGHPTHELLRCAQCLRPTTQELIDLSFDSRIKLLCSRREVQESDAARFRCIEKVPRSGRGVVHVDCR
jgi:hypothetical protein